MRILRFCKSCRCALAGGRAVCEGSSDGCLSALPSRVTLVAAFAGLINEKSLLVVFVCTSWMCEIETPCVVKHSEAKISKDENSRGEEIGILTNTPCGRDRTSPDSSGGLHWGIPGPGWCFPMPAPSLPEKLTQGTFLFGSKS